MAFNEHDIVKHVDGREGTIVHVYRQGLAFEVEFEGGVVETVYRKDIRPRPEGMVQTRQD